MIKLILLIIIIAMSIAILIFIFKKEYKISLIVLFSGVLLITLFSYNDTRGHTSSHKILLAYNNSKIITCNDINVTKQNFIFISGTNVFVGKRNSNYIDYTIPITKCKIVR
jgi:uncharacterized membrane protein YhfC